MHSFHDWMSNEGIKDWPKNAWNYASRKMGLRPQQIDAPHPEIEPRLKEMEHNKELLSQWLWPNPKEQGDINQDISQNPVVRNLAQKNPNYLDRANELISLAIKHANQGLLRIGTAPNPSQEAFHNGIKFFIKKGQELRMTKDAMNQVQGDIKTRNDWQRLANEPNVQKYPNPTSQEPSYQLGKKELYVNKATREGTPDQEIIQTLMSQYGAKTPAAAKTIMYKIRKDYSQS